MLTFLPLKHLSLHLTLLPLSLPLSLPNRQPSILPPTHRLSAHYTHHHKVSIFIFVLNSCCSRSSYARQFTHIGKTKPELNLSKTSDNKENHIPEHHLLEQLCLRYHNYKANRLCMLTCCLSCCTASGDVCVLHKHHTKKKLSLVNSVPTLSNLIFSNATNVRHLLEQYNLSRYADLLIDNGFDSLWALKALDNEILDTMQITKAGHKVLLL